MSASLAPVWWGLVGGPGGDYATSIVLHGGDPIVAGQTAGGMPAQVGFPFGVYQGGLDAFVSRVDPLGVGALATAYLGGPAADEARGVAVRTDGTIVVVGWTDLPHADLVTASAGSVMPCAGGRDGFAFLMSASLSSSFGRQCLGGTGADMANAVAVHAGRAYIVGQTASTNMPRSFSWADPFGPQDAWLVVLGVSTFAHRRGLVSSTLLGGAADDCALGVTVDPMGSAYVVGQTTGSITSPSTPLPPVLQPAYGGGSTDGFVVRVHPDP
jgi:hypothetical protein